MTRLVVLASRLAAVHAEPIAAALRVELPQAGVETIRLAQGEAVNRDQARRARARVSARYGIAGDALLFGIAGGLSPEKRVTQVLEALTAVIPYAPAAHLLLAGANATHYDVTADVRRLGLESRVTITGYLDGDEELTACIAAGDVMLNLRWPTAREVSGPWLRSLAAGRPTITIDLAHLAGVPALDPRTWSVAQGSGMAPAEDGDGAPVTVAIDIMDEDHSLRLAMRRLATDAALRESLGAAARQYWEREHSPARMVEDYRRVLAAAASRPVPGVALPAHLTSKGDRLMKQLLGQMSVAAPIAP
jgi:glycosyltransferase involved in cell wall biosynthesis